MKIRAADYIAAELERLRVKSVFLLSGGGMMHLIDALGRAPSIDYYCCHHEQACAMAAEAYARVTNRLGVCYATSGPGATNLMTGIAGAWLDSAPVLFITGQSNLHQTVRGSGIPGLRQFGTFETDIVPAVRPMTKYAAMVDDPGSIRYHLEKAVHLALNGRPGPVLLDIPLNVQGALVDPDALAEYRIPETGMPGPDDKTAALVMAKLRAAKRPLVLAGNGVRIAGAVELFRTWIETMRLPVATTQLGKDALPYDHELFVGHPGVKGDRAGNYAVQNADVLLSLGSSLHVQTTGYELDRFAPQAYKIQVELDDAVMSRENVGVSLKIRSGVAEFLRTVSILSGEGGGGKSDAWIAQCADWKRSRAVIREPHRTDGAFVNFYEFADRLSDLLNGDETIVTDAGSAFYVMGQAFRVKRSQRYVVSGALGAMGYALPAAIGIAAAEPHRRVVCVTGDGSLQTNVQELQTLRHYGFDIAVFVILNDGYVSIRNTQSSFFSGFLVGSSMDSGVTLPPLDKIAEAYGIAYIDCSDNRKLDDCIVQATCAKGPVICGIRSLPDQQIIPTVTSKRLEDGSMVSMPLDRMYPFIDQPGEENA